MTTQTSTSLTTQTSAPVTTRTPTPVTTQTASVERLSADALDACADELGELLAATVAAGASLGFLAGFGREEAARWWRGRAAEVADGRLLVWVARSGGRVHGTVGCAPVLKDNGRHRGEIVKLVWWGRRPAAAVSRAGCSPRSRSTRPGPV